VKVSKANKTAIIISNDVVFVEQLCEELIANPLYLKLRVLSVQKSELQYENLIWQQIELNSNDIKSKLGKGEDLFCRILNDETIEDYNAFIFDIAKMANLSGVSRAFLNIDLFQYLKKGSISKLFDYQELEETILKLPFWSLGLFITVKTSSTGNAIINVPDVLKSGSKYLGRKLLSALGLPLIVVPSKKIAKAMNLMTNSLNAGAKIYHSNDIQKILNNAEN